MGPYADMSLWGKGGWYLLKGVGFIVASFVFSVVFWWTKMWLEKCCQKPMKKKK